MTDLVKQTQLDRDKTALANPESAKQVMEIGKRASKLKTLYEGMKGYEEEYYKAFEVMIEAYWTMGVELRNIEKNAGGGDQYNTTGTRPEPVVPTLAQLGITKKQSSEWQTIALLPRVEIDDYIITRKQEHEPVAKTHVIELANNYKSAQQLYDEEVNRVIATMNAFIIQGRRVINHRLKYGNIEMKTKDDLFETSKLCEEILNQLNRATM